MSLVFGGTTVNNVVFNGVEVYTSGAPDGYLYLNGKARSGWNAWVYDNHGGLVVEHSTGDGEYFSWIQVGGYYYHYNAPDSKSVYIYIYRGTKQLGYVMSGINSNNRYISNDTIVPNAVVSKVQVQVRGGTYGEYLNISAVRYGR